MKLHLWDFRGLAEELREGELTEAAKALYLAVSVMLGLVLGNGGLLQMAAQPKGLLIWIVIAAGYGLGLLLVFRRNQAGDGARFIERYICLGVPAYVRMLSLLYGTYLGLWVVARDWVAAGGSSVLYALTLASFAAFFWWVWQGIGIAAGRKHEVTL